MVVAYGVPGIVMSTPETRVSDDDWRTALGTPPHPVVVVAGPTASGKSAGAIAIAETVGGVVINADSMQIYRELSVLTARPDADDTAKVPHKLFGALSASDPCSAARWRDLAMGEIRASIGAGRLPILCGGTGFYIRSLMEGLAEIPGVPAETRKEAMTLLQSLGGAGLRQRIADVDPDTADRLTDGDSQRLVRAWEVWAATGTPLSDWQARPVEPPRDLRFFVIVVTPERNALYSACNDRFDAMLARGAMAEIERLQALSLDPALPAMKAVGVPQLLSARRGEMSLEEAVETAKRETRRYAKRQTTWLRHQLSADLILEAQYSESLNDKIFPKIRSFVLTPPA